jgi:hypothetical protein
MFSNMAKWFGFYSDTKEQQFTEEQQFIDEEEITEMPMETEEQQNTDEINQEPFFIGSNFNSKKPAYRKSNLINIGEEIGIIGAKMLTVRILEEAIISKINGNTIQDKAAQYNIYGTEQTTHRGYVIAILELITGTINFEKTQPVIEVAPIHKFIKSKVWDTYIGKINGVGLCYVCSCEIDSKHFEVGHVLARCRGGSSEVVNLRPVCSLCNKSIGSQNMDELKEYYKLK